MENTAPKKRLMEFQRPEENWWLFLESDPSESPTSLSVTYSSEGFGGHQREYSISGHTFIDFFKDFVEIHKYIEDRMAGFRDGRFDAVATRTCLKEVEKAGYSFHIFEDPTEGSVFHEVSIGLLSDNPEDDPAEPNFAGVIIGPHLALFHTDLEDMVTEINSRPPFKS